MTFGPAEASSLSASNMVGNWRRWLLPADSLVRNGLALVLSAALSSLLGFAYWVLAARLFPPEVVGISSVMINSMITVASLGQLNLGNFLTRTLASAGPTAGRLILVSYLLAALSAAVFGSGFVLLSRPIAPALANAFSSPPLAVGYVLCIVVWTIFSLQDSVLAGLRQSVWIPVANGVFSLAKILLLVVLIGWRSSPAGPFLAWILPTFLLIPAVTLFIAMRAVAGATSASSNHQPRIGQIAGMMTWDYVATIAMMIGLAGAPILVLEMGGANAAAEYSVAWAITYSIYLVARSIGVSMIAEAAAAPAQRLALAARSLGMTCGLLAIGVVGVILFAPYLLLIFGQHYAGDNVKLLRLLALSTMPWGITTIYVAAARSAGRTGRIAAIQITTVALFFLTAAASIPALGMTGIGFAWLAAQGLVLAAICAAEFRRNPARLLEVLLRSALTGSRFVALVRPSRSDQQAKLDPPQAAVVSELLHQPLGDVAVRRVAVFDNDCETLRIAAAGTGINLYLKRATTSQGRIALQRHVSTIIRVRNDLIGASQAELLPQVLAMEHSSGNDFIIQRSVPGITGRQLLANSHDCCELLIGAADAMAAIHAAGCRETVIGSDWLEYWVDGPLAKIAALPRFWLGVQRKTVALGRIREEQYRYWFGKRILLGWHHGDFSPGNVFFDRQDGCEDVLRISGIIDWEGAVDNGPSDIDAWHLALTFERERREEEFGFIMRELILQQGSAFVFRPDRHLAGARTDCPPTVPATLAWLRHVESNLGKSERYGKNPLWCLGNIELVLESIASPQARGNIL